MGEAKGEKQGEEEAVSWEVDWGTVLAAYLAAVNVLLFAVMGVDKHRARRHLRRVPERRLFALCLLGGGLGGVLGMWVFRHKTRHTKFVVGFPLILLAETAALWFWTR